MKNLTLLTALLFCTYLSFAALPPITGITSMCDGTSTTLSNATPGGTWSSSNPSVATVGVSTGIVTGTFAGIANITYTLGPDIATTTVTVYANPGAISGASIACTGAISSYTIGSSGGAWSSSDPSVATIDATGGFTPVSPGTTTITYTLSTGCISWKPVTVNVGPTPITGSTVVCVSGITSLSSSPSGGTWATSASATAIVGSSSGVVTGVSGGTASIYYFLANGCSRTATVSVNATPGAISGTAMFCAGSTSTLSSTGYSGTWASGSASVATVGSSSGVVLGTGPGTAVITYTLGTCGTATRTVTIVAACAGTPVPGMITASAPMVCSGTPVVLDLPAYSFTCGHVIQWQYSPDGITWSDLAGANTVPLTYSPTAAYYYRCKITCSSTGATAYSGPVHVAINFEIGAHNIVSSPSVTCDPTHFYVSACGVSSLFSVKTFFGDGTSVTTPLSSATLSDAHIYHTYSLPGTYSVRHILFNAGTPVDTVFDSYNYMFCRTLPVHFYQDMNTNCVFDAGDKEMLTAITTRVDSNGIPVDTITATSGFSYKAYGGNGTVYAFRPLSIDGGLIVTCPSSGVVYDTINAFTNSYVTRQIGVRCSPAVPFDLKIVATARTGRHSQAIDILVTNNYCTAVSPVLTLNYSAKYGYFPGIYGYTTPAPASATGTTITWNLPSLAANATKLVTVWLERPSSIGPWLAAGDTVHTSISVSPTTGDLIPSNNTINRIDTVKNSFDPNDLAVAPEGYILPCTRLEYRVRFENTGNDTAHNISVVDTLPADVDPSTLQVLTASHAMTMSVINDGTYNIARFDFPSINLLDTSHHTMCNGMFIFSVKATSTVADGIVIPNRVGIYFDENPVVMTNEVFNETGLPPIAGPNDVCIGYPAQYINLMPGGTWSSSTPAVGSITATGAVSGLVAGTTTITYSISNACTSRMAFHFATVNPVVVPIVSVSSAPGDTVCAGVSVSYTATPTFPGSTPVYTWRVNGTSVGSSDTYSYIPLAGDTVTVSMASSQACAIPSIAADTVAMLVLANETPVATVSVSPGTTSCAGSPVTFTATPTFGGTAPGYSWYVNGTVTGFGASFTYTPVTGDVVFCRMGSNYVCLATDTVNSADVDMTVDPLYIPLISISASPGLVISPGVPVTFTAAVTGAGPSPAYQWMVNGSIIPGATESTFTSSTLSDYDSISCAVTGSGVCAITTFSYVFISVWPLGVDDASATNMSMCVFPNPNNGEFRLRGRTTGAGNAVVTVSNTLGQIIYTATLETNSGGLFAHAFRLADNVPGGVYILNVQTEAGKRSTRIVVNR
ncbi:MAG: Ig-like domain-containing protein [Taibaiella sp.]|nr:Ig-like domain-containing protein [Taibaiella sp.]